MFKDRRAMSARPELLAPRGRRALLAQPDPPAHRAHRATLDPQDHKAFKASKANRASRATPGRPAHRGILVLPGQPELLERNQPFPVLLVPPALKEFKATTAQRDRRACRAIKALSALRDHKAPPARPDRKAIPAQAARWPTGDRFGLPKIKLLRLQIQLIRSRSTTPILTQTGLALSQTAESRSHKQALIA